MIVRRALPDGGWEPAAVPSPAEMVRMACAEVGEFPNVRDAKSSVDGVPSVNWPSSQHTPAILKASRLMALRMYGAGSRCKCAAHLEVGVACRNITVAEALLCPDMTCGAL